MNSRIIENLFKMLQQTVRIYHKMGGSYYEYYMNILLLYDYMNILLLTRCFTYRYASYMNPTLSTSTYCI